MGRIFPIPNPKKPKKLTISKTLKKSKSDPSLWCNDPKIHKKQKKGSMMNYACIITCSTKINGQGILPLLHFITFQYMSRLNSLCMPSSNTLYKTNWHEYKIRYLTFMYFWWYLTTITKESESGHMLSTLISSVCHLESRLKIH